MFFVNKIIIIDLRRGGRAELSSRACRIKIREKGIDNVARCVQKLSSIRYIHGELLPSVKSGPHLFRFWTSQLRLGYVAK